MQSALQTNLEGKEKIRKQKTTGAKNWEGDEHSAAFEEIKKAVTNLSKKLTKTLQKTDELNAMPDIVDDERTWKKNWGKGTAFEFHLQLDNLTSKKRNTIQMNWQCMCMQPYGQLTDLNFISLAKRSW